MTYSQIKKIKYCADRLRAYEILYSIIADIESGNYEESDFEDCQKVLLDGLYSIRISKLKESSILSDFEDQIIDVLGESYFLYVPPESKTVKKLKKIFEKKKEELK